MAQCEYCTITYTRTASARVLVHIFLTTLESAKTTLTSFGFYFSLSKLRAASCAEQAARGGQVIQSTSARSKRRGVAIGLVVLSLSRLRSPSKTGSRESLNPLFDDFRGLRP